MSFPARFELSAIAAGDGTLGFMITGNGPNQAIGGAFAGAGDINGDGYIDLILGSPSADPAGREDAGELYIVFGSAAGFGAAVDLSNLDGADGVTIAGLQAFGRFGGPIAIAGDLNSDGIDDLAIGNSQAFPDGRPWAGQTYVLFGSANGFEDSIFDPAALDGTDGFVINGIDANDESGFAVAAAGDVNGDGIDDLLIGATLYGDSGYGETYVVFGSASGFGASIELADLEGDNGFVIPGVNRDDYSGRSVAGAGDVNGDGIGDLIIGATGADPGGLISAGGESYVVFGSSSGFAASFDLESLDGSNGFSIWGIDRDDFSGHNVDGAGDINGDGFDDLIVSARNANGLVRESYVVFGGASGFSASFDLAALDGSNGFTIVGPTPNDRNGILVSGAGDINGDGFDDLVIGMGLADPDGLQNAGESYVVFGGGSGFGTTFDLATLDGTNGFAIPGIEAFDGAGSIAGAGDVNGDGYDDIYVGTPGAGPRDPGSAGAAYIIYGRTSNQTEGTSGNDALRGAGGNDALYGYGGVDSLVGLDGDDYLNGGGGADFLRGADGDDFYDGVTSIDTIVEYGNRGTDTVRTREDDYVLGNNLEILLLAGRFALTGSGNALDNHIVGSNPGNSLFGLDGDDLLEGLRGADTLDGGAGNDRLEGGIGNDILVGGDGGDVLIGGAGRDALIGGTGADSFAFFDGDFAAGLTASADHIADFSRADGDRIDLSGLDAIIGTPESDSFAFVGTAAFSGAAGELRYTQRDGFVIVQGDTDGDGLADFGIRVDGLTDLTAADFVL